MLAIQYRKSVPRYLFMRMFGARAPRLYTGPLALVDLAEVAEPKLPSAHWVRLAPRLTGICGSDLATLCAKGSAYLAPVISTPFILGHEVVADVTEIGAEVRRVKVGARVVLRPALGCVAREISPLCSLCAMGNDALCRNITSGIVSAGIQTGFCRDTGGGFGRNLTAHESQVYPIPPSLDDETAVLVEPFACAMHGALRAPAAEGETVLVIGCGAIGLLAIAAMRSLGCKARIVAAARYDHQRRLALTMGANECIDTPRDVRIRYDRWSQALDARVLPAELGKPTVLGGADVTLDCAATSVSLDDGLRFTRARGRMVVIGMPGIPQGIDWTPMWYKELSVYASYAYGAERVEDQTLDTFDLALRHCVCLAEKFRSLVSAPYPLSQFRQAFGSALSSGRSGVVKTVFAAQAEG